MLNDLRNAVQKVPFEPFWIELSSGTEIPVPHSDHVWLRRARAVVEDDNGSIHILSLCTSRAFARNLARPPRD